MKELRFVGWIPNCASKECDAARLIRRNKSTIEAKCRFCENAKAVKVYAEVSAKRGRK